MKKAKGTSLLSFSTRVYKAFTVLLPSRFRERYAHEMTGVFRDCCLDAYHKKGKIGIFAELISGTTDLFTGAVKERLSVFLTNRGQTVMLLLISCLSICGGLYAAFSDLGSEEVPGTAVLLFLFALVLALIWPSSFVLSTLLIGLMLPLMHLVARIRGWELPYPTDNLVPVYALVSLIPALIGSLTGVASRKALTILANWIK